MSVTAPLAPDTEGSSQDEGLNGQIPEAGSELPDLSAMTKAQLLAYGAELGVEGISDRMTKAEIITAIEEGEAWIQMQS